MTKWDKKAKNYSRYNENIDSFEQRIFKTLNSLHVNFKNKTLLDVGCGTGVYTLHLAKECLHIEGLDSSKEMLEILKKDANKLNLKNINTSLIGWEEFKCEKDYDFALTTMSPALKFDEDIAKFSDCAKTKIYLGWAGKRDIRIIEALFEAHGKVYTPPNGALKIKKWLEKNNKFYHMIPFDEKKIRIRNFDEAVENFSWHLDIRGITPNKEILMTILNNFCDKNGNITETSINHMNLIIW